MFGSRAEAQAVLRAAWARPGFRPRASWYHDVMISSYQKEGKVARKAMTLRLDSDQAAEMEAVARIDGVSISEVARTAILAHVAKRRKDKDFQHRLRTILDRDREILERLATE
jgi:hypothetical protein